VWLSNEIHMNSIGISTIGDWAKEQLRNSKVGWQQMETVPNYEVL
jgi:hypothetical protein